MPPLNLHPTSSIHDASKIQDYQTCPRQYFYRHVLGWESEMSNVHLEFGTAMHLALEHLHTHDYSPGSVAEAYLLFEKHYRKHFGPEWDVSNSPKNPQCALRALQAYADYYREDSFEVLHTEVSGSVAISESRSLHFKTDTICHGDEGYFSLEHKTGSKYSESWAAQWRQKFQVGTYSHVLHCLYPPDEIYGVRINGIFPAPEPKLRKDGQPYANSRNIELHRIPVRRNLASMEAWLQEANYWLLRIESDLSAACDTSDDAPILSSFVRNTESCTHYGKCPFLDYCSLWNNPLRYSDTPPAGFRVRFWDPRSMEYIKKTMEL